MGVKGICGHDLRSIIDFLLKTAAFALLSDCCPSRPFRPYRHCQSLFTANPRGTSGHLPMLSHMRLERGVVPCKRREGRRQTACKPGSVRAACAALDGHSSGMPLTRHLARPTRAAGRECPRVTRLAPRRRSPLFGLAPGGVYPARCVTVAAVRSYRTVSPLPADLAMCGRSVLCGTVPGVAPAGR